MIDKTSLTNDELWEIFGKFNYEDNGNGSIKILGDWTKTHIVKDTINNQAIWHHRLITNQLENIMVNLTDYGLLDEFDLSNGGGCFVPRHKSWNLKRSLSSHSWGTAIDVNPKKYPYGSKSKPPAALIQAFEHNGFIWGGIWRTPDPMHFEWREYV